jgi:hypothetical protein
MYFGVSPLLSALCLDCHLWPRHALAVTGIDHQTLVVGVINEALQECLPHALVTPAAKSLMGVFPVAVGLGQIPPRCACTQNPEHSVDELPAVFGYPSSLTVLPWQQRSNDFPVLDVVLMLRFYHVAFML